MICVSWQFLLYLCVATNVAQGKHDISGGDILREFLQMHKCLIGLKDELTRISLSL